MTVTANNGRAGSPNPLRDNVWEEAHRIMADEAVMRGCTLASPTAPSTMSLVGALIAASVLVTAARHGGRGRTS